MVVFEGHDEFLGLIPRTILIQHYVSLRILLKQLVVHVSPATHSSTVYDAYCFSSLTAEVHQSLPSDKTNEKKPWLELVSSFSDKTATVNEATQADYGFTHGYESDTASDTFSTSTHFDLLHEDDELQSLQPSGKTGDLMEIDTHNFTHLTNIML